MILWSLYKYTRIISSTVQLNYIQVYIRIVYTCTWHSNLQYFYSFYLLLCHCGTSPCTNSLLICNWIKIQIFKSLSIKFSNVGSDTTNLSYSTYTSNTDYCIKSSLIFRHVIVCGWISFESAQSFLHDFHHEDRNDTDTHVVFVNT